MAHKDSRNLGEDTVLSEDGLGDAEGFPEAPPTGEEFDPRIAETVFGSLARWMEMGSAELDAELQKLEERHHEAIYAEMIFLLSHLRFPGREAKRYWGEIVQLRNHMQERLGSFVDVRVALASYFVQINRLLKNPKIVELQLFEQTRAFAYRDELTGLPNYRFLRDSLMREILRAGRTAEPVSLVMMDVDNFKEYNDLHGHEAGNVVLSIVGRLLSESMPAESLVARYGGEEFAAILPATSKSQARIVAERARQAVETHDIPHGAGRSAGRLTISLGIAACPGDAADASGLVRCADRALYAAKTAGKNQVQLYDQNRRSFRRVRASIEGSYRSLARSRHVLTTVNVSEGGLRFLTEQQLAEGSLIEVRLPLPGVPGEIVAAGRVVDVKARVDDSFETSVRLVAVDADERLLLSRFIAGTKRPAADTDSDD